MSKRYIGGTVRFDNPRKLRPAAGGLDNFKLCGQCNRYIPRLHYPEHVGTAHPSTVLHFSQCPNCEARPFTERAASIVGDCGNVLECEYCPTILIPEEYKDCQP